MALQAALYQLIVLLVPLNLVASRPNYFDYDMCDNDCIALNVSCLIEAPKTTFECECVVSSAQCYSEATPTRVCLRPLLPASGGEDIWITYRNQFFPNKPVVIDNSFLHWALALGGALIALTVVSLFTTVCFVCDRRICYARFANPSPTPPTDMPAPYLSTTELIPVAYPGFFLGGGQNFFQR